MTAAKKTPKKAPKKRASKKKKPPTNGQKDNVVNIKDAPKPSEEARAQTHLPGMKPEVDEDLTTLADELYNARTQRMEYGRLEKDAAARLLAEMQGKELVVYNDFELGLRVTVEATDFKVKVKKFDPDEE